MCVRYLGFVLLVWFPGVLHAQSAAQPCRPPRLNGGYLVPHLDTYSHETKIFYACDNGRKPAVQGWWATCTCQNGTWSHEPQCIDEKACMPPTIPNAIYTLSTNTNGWYEERDVIRITCDKGYQYKDRDATAKCVNGSWTSVPVCEKSIQACGAPPKIPHAVIILQGHHELFPADSKVQYECEDRYSVEGGDSKKTIICIAGNWTEGPTCTKTSTGSGTQPAGGGSGPGPGLGSSAGSGTPVGGGSSSNSGPDETEPEITTISRCGKQPVVPNGDVVEKAPMFLRYQCANFYKRVGPEVVQCYSDGTWTEVPTCKAVFCTVNTDNYPALIPDGVKFIKDGERVNFKCVQLDHWWTEHKSVGRCINGRMSLSRCCDWWDLKRNNC